MKCRLFLWLWVACMSVGMALPKSAVHAASASPVLSHRRLDRAIVDRGMVAIPSVFLAQTSTKQPSGNSLLVAGVLGLSAVVATGGGVLLVRRQLNPAAASAPDTTLPDSPGSLRPADLRSSSLPTAPIEPLGRSTNAAPLAPAVASTDPPLTFQPLPAEVTRLAKLNVVDQLIHDLRQSDPAKRHKAIWELGRQGDTRAVQPLVDLMAISDSRQRNLILSALSEISTRTLKPMSRALALSLQDESADVRKNAIRDLSRVYDLVTQMSQLLHAAAEDPDTEVSETARWAIGQLHRIKSPLIEPANFAHPPRSSDSPLPENR